MPEPFSYQKISGWVQTKAEIIKNFETGFISYQDIKEESITNNFRLRVLQVLLMKSKRWILFSSQAVKI